MNLAIRVRPEAALDLEDAAAWYETQIRDLGRQFLEEVRQALHRGRAARQPELYPSVHRNTRRALTRRFPFGVFYRIEDNAIVVVAMLHGSRNPQRWKQRT